MQTIDRLQIKNQLANITTPLRLPEIRKRAKSIADKIDQLQQQKLKLPQIKNSPRPEQKNLKQNKSQAPRVNFADKGIKNELKNILKEFDDADSEGVRSYNSNDFDFQSQIKNNREKIRINRVGRGNFLMEMKEGGKLGLLEVKGDVGRPKSSRDVTLNIKQDESRPKSSAVKSTSQNQQPEPKKQPQNSQHTGHRPRKGSFNIRSNGAKDSENRSAHLKVQPKGNLSARKSTQKPRVRKLSPLKQPKSSASIGNKDVVQQQRDGNIKRSQAKELKTQQLRDMKLDLQQRIKKIDEQMQKLNSRDPKDPKSTPPLPKRQKLLKMSTKNWNRLTPSPTPQTEPSSTEFDSQLQKIAKLQNKGEEILEDYVKNRIMLMDLNIYNKGSEIMEDALLGGHQQ